MFESYLLAVSRYSHEVTCFDIKNKIFISFIMYFFAVHLTPDFAVHHSAVIENIRYMRGVLANQIADKDASYHTFCKVL